MSARKGYVNGNTHPRNLLWVLLLFLWMGLTGEASAQIAELASDVLRCRVASDLGKYGGCTANGNTAAVTDYALSNRIRILNGHPANGTTIIHYWIRPDGTKYHDYLTYDPINRVWCAGAFGSCWTSLLGLQTFEELTPGAPIGQWSMEFTIDGELIDTIPFEVKPQLLTSSGPTSQRALIQTSIPLSATLLDYYDGAGVERSGILTFTVTRGPGGRNGAGLASTILGAGSETVTVDSNAEGKATAFFNTGAKAGIYTIEATSWGAPGKTITFTVEVVGAFECGDGADNDDDGASDFPNDPGCESLLDDSEKTTQCSDGIDNDDDGLKDFPNDPGCESSADETEFTPECSDGVDNDGNGPKDFPNDPGCQSAQDNQEHLPQCSDGKDNDGDGRADFPLDLGCESSADDSELEDGNEGKPDCPEMIGNPINVVTGNKYQPETDYQGSTPIPLTLSRSYNSLTDALADYGGSIFGRHWQSGYEQRILKDPNATGGGRGKSVVVLRGDGRRIVFENRGGNWIPNAGVTETLKTPSKGDKGWIYTTDADSVEYYDADGRLRSVTDRAGNLRTLAYDAIGRLDKITSGSGESLQFYYVSNLIRLVTNQAGQKWYFYHDQLDRLVTVTNPDKTSRNYHYENADWPYALTGITDETGTRYATFVYDDKGRAVSSYHGDGAERKDITFHTDGTRTVTDSLGNVSTYTTQAQNGRGLVGGIDGPSCSACGGDDNHYEYDPTTNNLLRKTSNGLTTTYGAYDAKGNPGFTIEFAGTTEERRTDYSYDPRFNGMPTSIRTTSVRTGGQRVESITYDALGHPLSIIVDGFDPAGNSVRRATYIEYNGPFGQISRIDGPRTDANDISTFEYYATNSAAPGVTQYDRGRLQRVIGPTGLVLRDNLHYSATGRLLSEDRPNGLHVAYGYATGSDRLETQTETANGESRVTRWTYLPTGEVSTVTRGFGTPSAVTLQYRYDSARRLVGITDGLGNRIDYTLDDKDNRLAERVTDPNGVLRRELNRTYDLLDRADLVLQANERLDYDYAPNGTLQSLRNGRGFLTTYGYDGRHRTIRATEDSEGEAFTTTFGYDTQDHLTSVTDPNGNTTRYRYDDLGNRLSTESPDTGLSTHSYDAAGNRVASTDAKGQQFTYHYDALGRMTRRDGPVAEDDTLTEYDTCTNGIGRVCRQVRGDAVVEYGYTGFGEIATLTQRVGAIQTVLRYAYDPLGRLRSTSYPSGITLIRDYDATGNVSALRLEHNGLTTALLGSGLYEPFGPLKSAQLGNGLALGGAYDSAYRLTERTDGPYSAAIAYDPAGNILALDASTARHDYGYDTLDRLIDAAGPYGDLGYGYDPNGNRLTLDDNGVVTGYSYDPASNRLLGAGPEIIDIDLNGNTTHQGGLELRYTADNRLAEVVGRAVYRYNALGQRIEKRPLAGDATYFVYDAVGALAAEIASNGTVTREYLYFQGRPFAVWEPSGADGALYLVHVDHLGTPQAVTDTSGTTVWSATYAPFGEASIDEDPDGDGAAFSFNLRFPGQYYDAESGLHYNYFRDYDPATGRYLESDPIGLRGGFNTYIYVAAHPTSAFDPLGLWEVADVFPDGAPIVTMGRAYGGVAAYATGWLTDDQVLMDVAADGLAGSRKDNIDVAVMLGTAGRGGGKDCPTSTMRANPRDLLRPQSRTEADPFKLADQIKKHGDSIEDMPPVLVRELPNGRYEILDGVTRAQRAEILRPGETIPITVVR